MNNSNTDYYTLFKSRQYTVTAHGWHPGYHLKVYYNYWKRLVGMKGIIDEQVIAAAKLEEHELLTMNYSCEEFCSRLFVRQSDNKRYKHLK